MMHFLLLLTRLLMLIFVHFCFCVLIRFIRNPRAATTILPLRRQRQRIINSEITHTGSAIAEGTRYVLMTSITLDEEEDYDDYEEEDDGDDINEYDE